MCNVCKFVTGPRDACREHEHAKSVSANLHTALGALSDALLEFEARLQSGGFEERLVAEFEARQAASLVEFTMKKEIGK